MALFLLGANKERADAGVFIYGCLRIIQLGLHGAIRNFGPTM